MSSHIFSALPPPVPPGKPPDGTGANGLQDENKLSFRDKLILMIRSWMEALVIKLLDKKLGYKMLKNNGFYIYGEV